MTPRAPGFGSLTPTQMRRILERELGYTQIRKSGSHAILKAPDRPRITLAIHATAFGPALVRDILVKQVGLTLAEAKEVVRRA